MDNGWNDASTSSQILQLTLQAISQLDEGLPRDILPPLAPQERYELWVPDLAALSGWHFVLCSTNGFGG